MSSNSNGGPRRVIETGLNPHALVIYIPQPLGRFLDDLRTELVPGCNPRAHMTVLPPRLLAADVGAAEERAHVLAAQAWPFEIEALEVEVFPVTNVIYIGVGRGTWELQVLHHTMNAGPLAFPEPFFYHPHITLAQEFDPAELDRLTAQARQRWSAYRGPRAFRAESVTFVQHRFGNSWVDLKEWTLGAVSPVPKL